jgi:hypothetical protein
LRRRQVRLLLPLLELLLQLADLLLELRQQRVFVRHRVLLRPVHHLRAPGGEGECA